MDAAVGAMIAPLYQLCWVPDILIIGYPPLFFNVSEPLGSVTGRRVVGEAGLARAAAH
jgi:hypothetical protein